MIQSLDLSSYFIFTISGYSSDNLSLSQIFKLNLLLGSRWWYWSLNSSSMSLNNYIKLILRFPSCLHSLERYAIWPILPWLNYILFSYFRCAINPSSRIYICLIFFFSFWYLFTLLLVRLLFIWIFPVMSWYLLRWSLLFYSLFSGLHQQVIVFFSNLLYPLIQSNGKFILCDFNLWWLRILYFLF